MREREQAIVLFGESRGALDFLADVALDRNPMRDPPGVENRMERNLIPKGRSVLAVADHLGFGRTAFNDRRANFPHAFVVRHREAKRVEIATQDFFARISGLMRVRIVHER